MSITFTSLLAGLFWRDVNIFYSNIRLKLWVILSRYPIESVYLYYQIVLEIRTVQNTGSAVRYIKYRNDLPTITGYGQTRFRIREIRVTMNFGGIYSVTTTPWHIVNASHKSSARNSKTNQNTMHYVYFISNVQYRILNMFYFCISQTRRLHFSNQTVHVIAVCLLYHGKCKLIKGPCTVISRALHWNVTTSFIYWY